MDRWAWLALILVHWSLGLIYVPSAFPCAQRDVGSVVEAIASYSRSLELSPDSRNAGQNRLLALNYLYPGKGGHPLYEAGGGSKSMSTTAFVEQVDDHLINMA